MPVCLAYAYSGSRARETTKWTKPSSIRYNIILPACPTLCQTLCQLHLVVCRVTFVLPPYICVLVGLLVPCIHACSLCSARSVLARSVHSMCARCALLVLCLLVPCILCMLVVLCSFCACSFRAFYVCSLCSARSVLARSVHSMYARYLGYTQIFWGVIFGVYCVPTARCRRPPF